MPRKFWVVRNYHKANKWLIEEELSISEEEDISQHFNIELLIKKSSFLKDMELTGLINYIKTIKFT